MILRLRPALLVVIALLALLHPALCQSSDNSDGGWITYQEPDGETVYLRENRRPSLYTGNYGDCLGSSLVNVSRFDAAYYRDNMTVLFHLAGNTALQNESLVMYIGVYAYGESRFDLLFNPCHANIESLCPLNSSVPIVASGIIPIAEEDVSNIPSIAYSIPDFEGQAILRIFANSTESEIGCYSAVVTNGNSFSHPKSVGSVLGIFAFVSMIASFGTAIYGEAVSTMRLHYAHSLSVGVVMAVYQHIYFTGALSVNWPSVLVAWWHNFAWAGGMIYSRSMQNSIDHLIGNNIGNTSQVGAAPSDSGNDNVGGGYDISQIYKRTLVPANHPFRRDFISEIFKDSYASEIYRRELLMPDALQPHVERSLQARDALANKTDGYRWYGHPIGQGMPLPGNYSGFAGTLAQENIRISNAFMTGFLWFLILLVLLVASTVTFKWTLEALARFKLVKQDRLKFFRDHWLGYTALVALRTCFIAFFLMMFLTIFQFTIQSSAGVKAIAAIVFVIFLVGLAGAAAYVCYYKKCFVNDNTNHQRERKKLLGVIPWAVRKPSGPNAGNEATQTEEPETKTGVEPLEERKDSAASVTDSPVVVDNIHDNEDYTTKFGWLASRFRRTRWWFFTVWLFYELVRAIFYAGASGYALVQVFGLLVIEFIAFVYIVWARPFEGRRLNILVIYCLGFSKVASVALSAAFDVRFNLPRITTTVIGIVVIVIQGVLTVITMIAIVVGAISSHMSISRNREDYRPRKWHGVREKYFDHLDRVANDLPRPPKATKSKKESNRESEVEGEVQAGFEVKGMRRLAKIEDEDEKFAAEMRAPAATPSHLSLSIRAGTPLEVPDAITAEPRSGTASPARRSRAGSLQSMSQSNLPYGARQIRPSWSARDFSHAGYDEPERSSTPVDMNKDVPDEDPTSPPPATKGGRSRTNSLLSMRSNRKSKEIVLPDMSTDSLRIGGDVSTRDTIGNVPAPTTRPRSGTQGSLRGSRPTTPGYISGDDFDESDVYQGMSRPNSRYQPPLMTPAQEREEWGAGLTPKQSREH